MEYNINENRLPVYYSTMDGVTSYPYCVIHGVPMKEPPLEKLHYHSVPEIGICVSGSGDYYIGDKIYRFKRGDIQIIRPFVPHFATSDVGATTKMVFFTFDTVKLMQLIGISDPEKTMMMKSINIPFNGIFSPDELPKITELVKKIISISDARIIITQTKIVNEEKTTIAAGVVLYCHYQRIRGNAE